MSRGDAIVLTGVRQHNLQGVDCRFPKGALTVVTGVSGSGKSSLVMDTLYAEGFRRYTEALSSYARRFLDKMRRPDVESVSGLQPAVAFGQRNRSRGARSTVGTATEVVDLLRVLFARAGTIVCPDCGLAVTGHSAQTAASAAVHHYPPSTGLLVTVRYPLPSGDARAAAVTDLVRDRHGRYLTKTGVERLDPAKPPRKRELQLVVDRVTSSEGALPRMTEAMEAAFRLGDGRAEVVADGAEPFHLSRAPTCTGCGRGFAPYDPQHLSFNNPLGACPTCSGFGRVPSIDRDLVIPDGGKTLAEGAVTIFTFPAYAECQDELLAGCRRDGIPIDRPWRDLSAEQQAYVWNGRGKWYGVKGLFDWLDTKRYKMHVRVMISRFRSYGICEDCRGDRLKPEATWVRLDGTTLPDLCRLPVDELQARLYGLQLTPSAQAMVRSLVRELRRRVDYLVDVGLGYLTLDRQTRTLSGGEAQRINLASALGAQLHDTLYVLDEPSVGLHPADLDRLVRILQALREHGNTVVVVEHEPRLIREADHVIDLGPGAGTFGGRILFEGPPAQLAKHPSATGRALGKKKNSRQKTEEGRRRRPSGWLHVRGARENNLQNIDVPIPLGVMTCITGVSGSGKSTLLESVVHAGLRRERGEAVDEVGRYRAIEGAEAVTSVELIDQSPVARSGRSNPATYLDVFTPVRTLLARTRRAKELGLKAGYFSFNVPGGRCEACQGNGAIDVDLQFLGETTVPCDCCNGSRFGETAKVVRYRGFNVVDILGLTVDQALELFVDEPAVAAKLRLLAEMGLGYLGLGQPTSTLSAGESQRLKLARQLDSAKGGLQGRLLLLDEPTTGLHPADIERLLGILDRLVDGGAGLLVVEHNLDLLRRADWILDLGPGGGGDGGRLVAQGTPETLAQAVGSATGRYLADVL